MELYKGEKGVVSPRVLAEDFRRAGDVSAHPASDRTIAMCQIEDEEIGPLFGLNIIRSAWIV